MNTKETRIEKQEMRWTNTDRSAATQTDVNRHRTTGTNSCNYLMPECLTALAPFRKTAFTLAEVLITLAVIGIVAALTLPGLIQNHNQKAWSTAKDLWEKKLTETVRRMNVDGVMTGHDTTEDFLNTFKNYMKVIKTCYNSEINKCYSPKVVTTGKDEEPIEIETDTLKSSKLIGAASWQANTNTVSFIVADGTTVIMAYNPDCPYADPIEDQGSQVSCLAMITDVNGNKGPNRVGKDIKLSSGVALSKCDNPVGNMCWSTDFLVTNPEDTCDGTNEYDPKYTSSVSSNCSRNYWAAAKKACADIGMELPTMAQLAELTSNIYTDSNGDEVTIGATEEKRGLVLKDNPPIALGCYPSNDEIQPYRIHLRNIESTNTNLYNYMADNKWYWAYRAVCISN